MLFNRFFDFDFILIIPLNTPSKKSDGAPVLYLIKSRLHTNFVPTSIPIAHGFCTYWDLDYTSILYLIKPWLHIGSVPTEISIAHRFCAYWAFLSSGSTRNLLLIPSDRTKLGPQDVFCGSTMHQSYMFSSLFDNAFCGSTRGLPDNRIYSKTPQNTPKTPYFTLKFSRFYPHQESFVYIDPKTKTDKVVPKIDKIDYWIPFLG